ncbi:MAG: hypothetical protein O3B24_05730, partial [Verrucomicrobia bacterium]|nr:hypothetical protein [Verrucomicrobiota bacterium]
VPPFMTQLTNMVYEVAFVGDVGVVTMGGAELMNGSLDRLASPGTSITERPLIRSMFGNDPNLAKATDVATFSLVDYMKFIVSMMPGVDASMLEMIPASGSGIGAYSVAEGNTEVSVMKLGIAEIVTLKSMAPMMMMGAMSRSAGQGGMGGSGGDYEPEMDDEEDVPYTDDMDSDE